MLVIYNSLTRKKEAFKPIVEKKVGVYVCGITVYDYCHVGHARVLVCFDIIIRYLRSQGYEVNYIRNITDIDDKIINRANELGENFTMLTKRFIDAMHADENALYILKPDSEPKATDHMPEIITLIERLIDNNHAYIADNGDVYYDVTQFHDYGKLSHKDIQGQEAGARIDIVSMKKNPLDFVLWKQAKEGEPSWSSPWGKGRPGWHIECSAMSMNCLGEQFDIHGGGFDLQFPHHENEIAQSEGATGKKLANYWMHIGYLQINREKMSKSLGNFFTIREVLDAYHPETVRYFLLSAHYRSQLNYSTDNLDSAQGALERLYTAIRGLTIDLDKALDTSVFEQRFNAAMDDDFNTPEAMAVLFEMTYEINRLRTVQPSEAIILATRLTKLSQTLGILNEQPEQFLKAGASTEQAELIESLIKDRNQARTDKNWQRADEIRQQLTDMGVELEDGAQGTTWRMR